jgi:hypothetical protein
VLDSGPESLSLGPPVTEHYKYRLPDKAEAKNAANWLVARHAKTVILRTTARANKRALETFTLYQIFILNGDNLQPAAGSAECSAIDSGGRDVSIPPSRESQ